MNAIYVAVGTAIGGRGGQAQSSDGELSVKLVRPPALGGTGKGGTNPEQLFACGYAACFASTLDHLARQKRETIEPAVTARVGLVKRDEGGYGLTVTLEISLPHMDESAAWLMIHAAHQICPYSNSIRGNVDVELQLLGTRDG